ncbi:citryl-CoA lyase [Methanobacterium sp. VT]|uniref:Citryl-CoA lyase n=1 Tax=Methanobacterium spitsbergense TaxID=2874285 RepID=A0A8T5URS5_9EURY|nr:citryl-CoA lyase [Methanobacterium spitsbergense]
MITEEIMRGMLKPKNSDLRTSITQVETNMLKTQGFFQEEIIGNFSFAEMVYLLLKGEKPSENHKKMFEAVLISFCDHGITPPSTQSARLMASAGSPVNVCIAGGILAFGENHAGAIENAMKIFQEGVKISDAYNRSASETARFIIEEYRDQGKKIPGFGHRYHSEDPRARKLLEIAQNCGCNGKHFKIAIEMEKLLLKDKGIKINIDGANAAILSDMKFNWHLGCGIFAIGRIPGLLAHITEEILNEDPFRKITELKSTV